VIVPIFREEDRKMSSKSPLLSLTGCPAELDPPVMGMI
jgi:hypothetical protein